MSTSKQPFPLPATDGILPEVSKEKVFTVCDVNSGFWRTVRETPTPTDVKGAQRLVGMINYLSKFYNHLPDNCEILRQLTHKDIVWAYTDAHEEAFQRRTIKVAGISPVLKYYDQDDKLM